MGYLDPERSHVFARVPLARVEQKVSRPFSEEEFERLLAGCDRSRLTGCRNYALLLFLLDNGMRAQECASVLLEEVDWERRRVLVHGKGAKQRWVGIGGRTVAALRDYVERFRGGGPGALFLTRGVRPCGTGTASTCCSAASRGGSGSRGRTRTASATASRPGRSPRGRASSTCSCCSGTPRRR